MAQEREVSKGEAIAHLKEIDPTIPYYEMSCKTGENANFVFEEALRLWMKKKMPSKYTEKKKNKHGKDDCIIS